jgi:hypothetical protein
LISAIPSVSAAQYASRRDGFLQIWRSISRPAEKTKEKTFSDVPVNADGGIEITYAKARGILDDAPSFNPDDSLDADTALLWLFRTRGIERIGKDGNPEFMTLADPADISELAGRYVLSKWVGYGPLTSANLLDMMRSLDTTLASQVHEASLYAENFHGDGTAFGEKFDMYALTAAHRSFPYNTLVRVTNTENGKSVVVRINDRGPFVKGRDMDLSLASFTTIADRAKGKISVRFERLGDVALVQRCNDERYQRRITKDVILSPGIPHSFGLGKTLHLLSPSAFVIRNVIYPDGVSTDTQTWVTPGERFDITPSIPGTYTFIAGTPEGRQREMRMEVVDCGADASGR